MRMIVVLLAALLAAPLAANAQSMPALLTHGIVVANMDRAVKPGDDFYRYANGDWLKRTEIPSNRSYIDPYGGDLDFSSNLTRKRIAGVIEEAAKANAPAGSKTRKIVDFYHSYMDEATIEAKGLAPLRPHLDAIAAIRDKHDLARTLGESLRAEDAVNIDNFHTANLFGLWVAPGFNDPEHYAAYLLQGGLEMPDREYYLSDSDSMRDLRAKYQTHVSAMLKLAGFHDTNVRAQHIVELEHAIAEKHVPLADRHDIEKANNTWKQADFAPTPLASTGQSTFAAPGSGGRPASSSGSPPPSPESPRSLPLSRWTRGETGWPSD